MLPLILASNSPRRAALLRGLARDFQVISSGAAESECGEFSGRELAQLNAFPQSAESRGKNMRTRWCWAPTPSSISATLFTENRGYGGREADDFRAARQDPHEVIKWCLPDAFEWEPDPAIRGNFTKVTFHPLEPAQIQHYLNQIDPLDKAGAYAIQEHGEEIVKEITGSFSNVVGMPMEKLEPALRLWSLVALF